MHGFKSLAIILVAINEKFDYHFFSDSLRLILSEL